MFGQPELDEKLSNPAVRQLRQRIVFHYRMPGLREPEARHYLAHRLRVAGIVMATYSRRRARVCSTAGRAARRA